MCRPPRLEQCCYKGKLGCRMQRATWSPHRVASASSRCGRTACTSLGTTWATSYLAATGGRRRLLLANLAVWEQFGTFCHAVCGPDLVPTSVLCRPACVDDAHTCAPDLRALHTIGRQAKFSHVVDFCGGDAFTHVAVQAA